MLRTAPVHERHIMDMTGIKWSRLFCGHNYTQIAKKQSVIGHHLLLARVETKKVRRQTYWSRELPRREYLFSDVCRSAIDIARK